ncbi:MULTISPECIES: hypothetical protein [Micrococcaceae]|uniref:hypothetical protein n=1 Tax=Micrococcaceae TaxID=1268 RepID=UPI001036E700|nr:MULTISPECIES: hypothetical protein [Micrococcaceae]TAP25739.1 hypothetical protein EYR88_12315 [Arthrobacter sp. S41]UXN31677.1 hypothetical protein N6V40_15315 [Glutamicibacter sp. M10]
MLPPAERFQGRDTLRYVRLMLLVVPLLLVVAIVIYGIVNQRIEDSLSSYYLGPARDLFVAMLVTTGALLVVYSGEALEDYALNLAGFYAMFVALVPTRLGETLATLAPAEQGKLILSVRVAIVAVLIVSAAFVWLGIRTSSWPHKALMHSTLTRALGWISTGLLAVFILLLIWRAFEGKTFAWVHASAAFLLIFSMGIAIASHLGHAPMCHEDTSGGSPNRYRIILGLMALGLIAWPILLVAGVDEALFIVEWFQIGLFAYFWYLESRRLWDPVA